ncbi:SRPBCC family protein [Nonomuraea sp. SMC257]|uniref:SRPBCC family protein n=2 Tax=Nonomuraea montanisoli TaxID=2741721 RepID=A0A7Y6I2L3_9ACTN|nr:SRPBCC family protein [Nonomuraea montanisoli]
MALAERALGSITEKLEEMTDRLTDVAEGDGSGLLQAITGGAGSGLLGTLTGKDGGGFSPGKMLLKGATKAVTGSIGEKIGGLFGKGKGGKGGKRKLKLTHIFETIDIGAPIRIVYNQWTKYEDFPTFTKKVDSVSQESEEKVSWKAQVFWSHRTWKSTIQEQIPDDRIIWRSEGPKGWVDGAVSFHELAPSLTRVIVVLEYHPQGLFERTGNLWRAQGRRARLELKHVARHVMRNVMLHPDEMADDGWRGEIHDGEVTKDHETAMREEREREEGREGEEEPEEYEGEEGEYEGEEGEGEGEEPEEGEEEEEEEEEEEGEEEPEGEEEEEEQPVGRAGEDEEGEEGEEEEEEEEEAPRARRPARRRTAARR